MKYFKVIQSSQIVEGALIAEHAIARFKAAMPDLVTIEVFELDAPKYMVLSSLNQFNDDGDDSVAGYSLSNGEPIYR